MKKPWAKATVTRVRGVHCVRLDDITHQIAKDLSEKYGLTIKDIVKISLMENDWKDPADLH